MGHQQIKRKGGPRELLGTERHALLNELWPRSFRKRRLPNSDASSCAVRASAFAWRR